MERDEQLAKMIEKEKPSKKQKEKNSKNSKAYE